MTMPRLRAPIVLVHGLFGFGRFQVAGRTMLSYWPGIPEAIEKPGNRVLVPAMSPTCGVADRAKQLKAFLLSESPTEPVHVIAHSMGGLDARYMISKLDMAPHVLSLTTLGTPHRGSSFADWGVGRLARVVRPVFDFLDVPCQAFYDLTRTSCRSFNDCVPDAPAVRYFSVAGRHDGNFRSPEWVVPYRMIQGVEGDNDGIVAVESARYGEAFDVWEGDHVSLVNWPGPGRGLGGDPAAKYARLLQRLADLDF